MNTENKFDNYLAPNVTIPVSLHINGNYRNFYVGTFQVASYFELTHGNNKGQFRTHLRRMNNSSSSQNYITQEMAQAACVEHIHQTLQWLTQVPKEVIESGDSPLEAEDKLYKVRWKNSNDFHPEDPDKMIDHDIIPE